jgi:hypothetical protein
MKSYMFKVQKRLDKRVKNAVKKLHLQRDKASKRPTPSHPAVSSDEASHPRPS